MSIKLCVLGVFIQTVQLYNTPNQDVVNQNSHNKLDVGTAWSMKVITETSEGGFLCS